MPRLGNGLCPPWKPQHISIHISLLTGYCKHRPSDGIQCISEQNKCLHLLFSLVTYFSGLFYWWPPQYHFHFNFSQQCPWYILWTDWGLTRQQYWGSSNSGSGLTFLLCFCLYAQQFTSWNGQCTFYTVNLILNRSVYLPLYTSLCNANKLYCNI